MRNRIFFFISVVILAFVVAYVVTLSTKSNTVDTEEVSRKEVVTDKSLAEELGKAKTPYFYQVTQAELTKEELEMTDRLKNAVGVSQPINDLFVIVTQKEKNKVRYITEVQEEDNTVKVYLRLVDAEKDGESVLFGRIDGFSAEKQSVWFLDAETREPIQLEDLNAQVSNEVKESVEATTIETTDENAKGSIKIDTPATEEQEEPNEEGKPEEKSDKK